MKYDTTIEIAAPRNRVIELFVEQDNYPHWQESLVHRQHIAGEPGEEGRKTRLLHKMGKREIETIVKKDLPALFVATYTSDAVYNKAINRFAEIDEKTTAWTIETEFRCKGMMKVMTTLMPGMFKKQTLKTMNAFRAFVESSNGAESAGSPDPLED